MKNMFIIVLVCLFACKRAPEPVTAVSPLPASQEVSEENANYATHPGIDLEVQPFLDNLRRLDKSDKSQVMLIDMRTPPEFDDGYIPGAIMINYLENDIDQQLGQLDKNKTYFVYCQQGARSSKGVDKMLAMGFKKIYYLIGGYEAYQSSGLK
jgi:rhodanese-related sulfurtransferase